MWHILAVGLPDDFAPPGENETAAQMANRAMEAGAYYERITQDAGVDATTPEEHASVVIGELTELPELFGLLMP